MIRKGKTYLKEQEGIAFLWIFIDGYISYAFLFFPPDNDESLETSPMTERKSKWTNFSNNNKQTNA